MIAKNHLPFVGYIFPIRLLILYYCKLINHRFNYFLIFLAYLKQHSVNAFFICFVND